MSVRQFTEGMVANQENANSKIMSKTVITQLAKGLVPKRTALGEVGNTLPLCSNNAITKKVEGISLPREIPKKAVDNIVSKKVVTKIQEKSTSTNLNKPILKEQEIIVKKSSIDNVTATKEVEKSYSSKQLCIIDHDEKSKNDPQMVTEYLVDIYSYLRELESKYPIRKNFLEGHRSTARMYAILTNWLIEVHMTFKFYLETLHLCIAIVNRYLQDNKSVGRGTLQLVGTAAMVIACKYEEIYIPDINDFVYICDDTFSRKQIFQMEIEILKKLDFNLGRPLSLHFLRHYNKIARVGNEHHTLGKYILELALLKYEMSHVKPSIQAAAACCLAIGILKEIMDLSKVWTPTLVHYTTYEYSDFKSVIIDLAHLIVKIDTSDHQAVRKKYASIKYGKISLNSKLQCPLIKKLTRVPLKK